ncbi:hypothetical protein BXY82_0606 [Gelidibacter sediminis]|uniref:Uncharacterized protein n=1 Tax=Gelidibacter sediminis TaxID=1608710 RepID=A0A4R7Q6R1_9FLAO|nr:hypothetical protein [Gelidibacter sediminis]TDU43198.1 hypothetical protein BXY82_0606 [Gelidibacter sediminis]
MNYYTINTSDDLKIIGHYPQTRIRVDTGENVRVDGYLAMKANDFPDFVPNFKLELHHKAKPTNFLPKNPASFGWIIDTKFKMILDNYNLPKHHYYKVKVYQNNKILDYYWLHYIVDDFWDFIDTDKSYVEVFKFETPFDIKVIKNIPIISQKQIIEEEEKYDYGNIRIGSIKMNKHFPKYDLYQTRCINYNTIISENLRNDLIKEGMTGFETKLYDKFETTD